MEKWRAATIVAAMLLLAIMQSVGRGVSFSKHPLPTLEDRQPEAPVTEAVQVVIGVVAESSDSSESGQQTSDVRTHRKAGRVSATSAVGKQRLFTVRQPKTTKRSVAVATTMATRDGSSISGRMAVGQKIAISGERDVVAMLRDYPRERLTKTSGSPVEDGLSEAVLRYGLDVLHQCKPGTVPSKREASDALLTDEALMHVAVESRNQAAGSLGAGMAKSGGSVVTTVGFSAGVRAFSARHGMSVVVTDTTNTYGTRKKAKSEVVSSLAESRITSTASKDTGAAHLVNVDLATFERDLFSGDSIVSSGGLVDSHLLTNLALSVAPRESLAESGSMAAAVMQTGHRGGKRSSRYGYNDVLGGAGAGEISVVHSTEMLVDTLVAMQGHSPKSDGNGDEADGGDSTAATVLSTEPLPADALSLEGAADDALSVKAVFAETLSARPSLANAADLKERWLTGGHAAAEEGEDDETLDQEEEVPALQGISVAMVLAVRETKQEEVPADATELAQTPENQDVAPIAPTATPAEADELWRKEGYASARVERATGFLAVNTGRTLEEWSQGDTGDSRGGLAHVGQFAFAVVLRPGVLAFIASIAIGGVLFGVARRRPVAKTSPAEPPRPSKVNRVAKRTANRKVRAAADRS